LNDKSAKGDTFSFDKTPQHCCNATVTHSAIKTRQLMIRRARGSVVLFVVFMTLSLMAQPALADSIQVTFTGQIYWTFDEQFGGPGFNGIQSGDSFSSVLT